MTSYRVVVPPGWILLPVRDRTDHEIRDMITERYRDLPRDSSGPHISRLADAIVSAARTARSAHVVDILLPLGTPWRAPVSASIALAVGTDAAEPTGSTVETEAGTAWREEPTIPRSETDLSTRRRVTYQWRIPNLDHGLLVATASVVGPDDAELLPIVDAITDLCEAILATIRWSDDDDDPADGKGE
jgi:hypothetical protein